VLVVGSEALGDRARELEAAGADLLQLPAAAQGLDLAALWPLLAERGINEVHVEAGAALNGSLFAGDWVDEWLVYLSPRLLGKGRGLADLPVDPPPGALDATTPWRWIDCQPVGNDLRLRARRAAA
jgi:diaminohydroxyphosphoribosylaminopyrimidine deaminase/5-amino-6-(5-phosphoribosylamino)uracil reductase